MRQNTRNNIILGLAYATKNLYLILYKAKDVDSTNTNLLM